MMSDVADYQQSHCYFSRGLLSLNASSTVYLVFIFTRRSWRSSFLIDLQSLSFVANSPQHFKRYVCKLGS